MPSLIQEDTSVPGIHALVIGVSHYPYVAGGASPTPSGEAFNIGQLSSAARSASEFAAWLLTRHRLPDMELKSLRVLLSPVEGEQINADIEALLPSEHEATADAVREALGGFKAACDSHRDNVAIVYVAGHGVQPTTHGATLLLHDFGRPGQLTLLECAIDMVGVHAGMDHENTAQRQFWFVDICRQRPEIARHFEQLSAGITLDQPGGRAYASALYFSTSMKKEAFGIPGDVSVFYKALHWALEEAGAAEGANPTHSAWHVTTNGLNQAVPAKVTAIASSYDVEQPVHITGSINEVEFHRYETTPETDLRLLLREDLAASGATGTLIYNATEPVLQNCTEWPIEKRVRSGLYLVRVNTAASPGGNESLFSAVPPLTEETIPNELGRSDG